MSKLTPRYFTLLGFFFVLIVQLACVDEDLSDLWEANQKYEEEKLLDEQKQSDEATGDYSEEADLSEDSFKDSDEDGVPDDIDKCDQTSKGVEVNEFGCSTNQ